MFYKNAQSAKDGLMQKKCGQCERFTKQGLCRAFKIDPDLYEEFGSRRVHTEAETSIEAAPCAGGMFQAEPKRHCIDCMFGRVIGDSRYRGEARALAACSHARLQAVDQGARLPLSLSEHPLCGGRLWVGK